MSKASTFMVAYGTLADGYTFVGPFDSSEEAVDYAEGNGLIGWDIIPLYAPAAEG